MNWSKIPLLARVATALGMGIVAVEIYSLGSSVWSLRYGLPLLFLGIALGALNFRGKVAIGVAGVAVLPTLILSIVERESVLEKSIGGSHWNPSRFSALGLTLAGLAIVSVLSRVWSARSRVDHPGLG